MLKLLVSEPVGLLLIHGFDLADQVLKFVLNLGLLLLEVL